MKLVIIENEYICKVTEEQAAVFKYIRKNHIDWNDIAIVEPDDVDEFSDIIKEEF